MTTIISWNVNGLRALHRKGNFAEILEKILLIQKPRCLS